MAKPALKLVTPGPPKAPPVAREYQPPAIALEEHAPRAVSWWVLYTVAAIVVIGVVWASLAEVDRVVTARGNLTSAATTLTVQALERVSIKAVHVKVGDIVRQGDVLASLDPTFAAADVTAVEGRHGGFVARAARLEAELAGREYSASAPSNLAQVLEATLFANRKLHYQAKMRVYEEDLSRHKASVLTQRADQAMLSSRTEMLRGIEEIRAAMVAKEFDSRLRLLDARSQRLAVEREMQMAKNKIVELEHQIASTTAEREAFIQDWNNKIADELTTVRRERDTAAEDLNKAMRRRDLVALTAPQDAVVLDIAQRSGGSILREAEALFTLVPLNAPLVAEARLMPIDVGFVKVGDEVRVKLDAFPFQKHGTGRGRVTTISADSFPINRNDGAPQQPSASGEPPTFHKARIELTSMKLRNIAEDYRLIAGMTVSAEILVGKRTVISYLLYPIFKGLDESAREP